MKAPHGTQQIVTSSEELEGPPDAMAVEDPQESEAGIKPALC